MSRKGVNVVIGSKGRTFRYNLNSLAELEAAINCRVQDMEPRKFGFREHRAVVWAALLHEEPKLTLVQAGDLLTPLLDDAKEYGEIIDAALSAFAGAFPDRPEGAEAGTDPNVTSATSGETSSS